MGLLNPLRWLARLLKRSDLTDGEKRALDTVAIYSVGGMSYDRSDDGTEDGEDGEDGKADEDGASLAEDPPTRMEERWDDDRSR